MPSYEMMYQSICKMLNCDFGKAYGTIENMQKQIAELQEKLLTLNLNHKSIKNSNQKLIMDNANLKEKVNSLERQLQSAVSDLTMAQDKLHRRNLQIADLKKKYKNIITHLQNETPLNGSYIMEIQRKFNIV